MNRKPKYTLFKNSRYAFEGFIHMLKVETSFKIELFVGVFAFTLIFILPFTLWQQFALIGAYFLLLIVETLNSAIENVVDLVTQDHHLLAKAAKDVASAAVMLSIVLNLILWSISLVSIF